MKSYMETFYRKQTEAVLLCPVQPRSSHNWPPALGHMGRKSTSPGTYILAPWSASVLISGVSAAERVEEGHKVPFDLKSSIFLFQFFCLIS